SDYPSSSEYGGRTSSGRGDYGRTYNYGRGSDYRLGNYGREHDYSDYTPSSERGYGPNYSSASQSRYFEGTNRPPDYGRNDEWRSRDTRDYRAHGDRGWWD